MAEITTNRVPKLLLGIDEAANALSIGRSTLWRLIQKGEIRVVRIGRAVRIPTADLQAWIDKKAEV